jgi:hypothetical protein
MAYRELTPEEKLRVDKIKFLERAFIAKCNEIGGGREMSLAITNMEQASMWAVKAITK